MASSSAGWRALACLALLAAAASAQDAWVPGLKNPSAEERVNAVQGLSRSGDAAQHLDQLEPLVYDSDQDVRAAVSEALTKVRTVEAQRLLTIATGDSSPAVQLLAVDGLVDFYAPGYARKTGSLRAFMTSMKGRLISPTPMIVPSYVEVSPDVIQSIARVLREGASVDARANAARGLGVLRAHSAVDALVDGVRTGERTIVLQSVLALHKIRMVSAGPEMVFLLTDSDRQLREAAINAAGQLRTLEAVPNLVRIVESNRAKDRERVMALTALAKIPGNGQRELFLERLIDKNKRIKAAAAEGVGRIANSDDARLVDHHFALEKNASTKLSLAFAAVHLGNLERVEDLVKALNSSVHRLEARPFLVELARKQEVLELLYEPMATGTPNQRRHLAVVVARSGTSDSISHLENLSRDTNEAVSTEAIDSLRVLRARL